MKAPKPYLLPNAKPEQPVNKVVKLSSLADWRRVFGTFNLVATFADLQDVTLDEHEGLTERMLDMNTALFLAGVRKQAHSMIAAALEASRAGVMVVVATGGGKSAETLLEALQCVDVVVPLTGTTEDRLRFIETVKADIFVRPLEGLCEKERDALVLSPGIFVEKV